VEDEPRYEPAAVDANTRVGLRITWADGHVSSWGLETIREVCKCAECGERRRTGLPVRSVPGDLDVVDAELIGAYGITFVWSDGHSTGVYHWDRLRDGCPCDDCVTERRSTGQNDPLMP